MKKIIQSFSIIVSVLSLIFFLYGSIKLYRIESGNYFQNIESGIPGVEIVQPSNLLTREDVQGIIALSVAGFVIGIGGYVISSNMKDPIPTPPRPKPDQNQESNQQLTEKTPVESQTESSTQNQQEENQEINQQSTENTRDTEEKKSNDSPENS